MNRFIRLIGSVNRKETVTMNLDTIPNSLGHMIIDDERNIIQVILKIYIPINSF
jgi:hypothetical protein